MSKYAAFGAKLQKFTAPSTYTDIAGIRDLNGPGMSADTIDVTTQDSTDRWREFMKTLLDAGEITFDLVFDPEDNGSQKDLLTALQAATSETYRIVFNTTNAKKWTVVAFVTGFEPAQPLEGEIAASVTMKVTGKPNFSPA